MTNNLALDLSALGEYGRPRRLNEDILTRYLRVLDDDHSDILRPAHTVDLALTLQKYFLANDDRGDNAANDELVAELVRWMRTSGNGGH